MRNLRHRGVQNSLLVTQLPSNRARVQTQRSPRAQASDHRPLLPRAVGIIQHILFSFGDELTADILPKWCIPGSILLIGCRGRMSPASEQGSDLTRFFPGKQVGGWLLSGRGAVLGSWGGTPGPNSGEGGSGDMTEPQRALPGDGGRWRRGPEITASTPRPCRCQASYRLSTSALVPTPAPRS